MALTADELVSLSNASLDFYVRSKPLSQVLQNRPLYEDLISMSQEFGGALEFVKRNVKGVYSSSMIGYSHDDDVSYVNPANIKQSQAKWYEVAAGIEVFYTELKANGIHVVDSMAGKNVRATPDELQRISNIFDDKNEDLMEGSARSLASMFWQDGTQDAKAIPGIRSIILDSPTTGTTLGISRTSNTWWRNRATLSIDSSTATNLNIVKRLQLEFRQLRRYGNPKHKMYAGSTFLDLMEKELRSLGYFTFTGWAKQGRIDASMSDLEFKSIPIMYDPTLDDLGYDDYLYVLDMKAIKLWKMKNEWMLAHNPARPPEKYVLYRGLTATGAMCAEQLNTSGVYSATG